MDFRDLHLILKKVKPYRLAETPSNFEDFISKG